MVDVEAMKILKKISEKLGIDVNTLKGELKRIIKEYDGFLSERSAAILLSKKYGIDVRENNKKLEGIVKISNLASDLRGIYLKGKVVEISNELKSKKGNLYRYIVLSDDSGTIRVFFWDKDIERVKSISVGDVIIIKVNVSKGKVGLIAKYAGGDIKKVKEKIKVKEDKNYKRKFIDEINEKDDYVEICGVVTSLFSSGFIVDDGTGSIIIYSDKRVDLGDFIVVRGKYLKDKGKIVETDIKIANIEEETHRLINMIKKNVNGGS